MSVQAQLRMALIPGIPGSFCFLDDGYRNCSLSQRMCYCKAVGAGADNDNPVVVSLCIVHWLHFLVPLGSVTVASILGGM